MKMKWMMAGFQGSRPFLFYKKLFFCVISVTFLALFPAAAVHAEPVKIVIDPGHGGENLGGQYGSYTEKYMTMVVAEAMVEELEKYEGIEVYLTRTDDTELSLQKRWRQIFCSACISICRKNIRYTERKSGYPLSENVMRREKVSGICV